MTGPVLELDEVASTQDEVLQRLQDVKPGAFLTIIARSQSHGRGRDGRSWQDGPGAALLMSVGRRGPVAVEVLDDLPRRIARALLDALVADAALPAIVWKEPNDLVGASDGAKVAGILVDARTTGALLDHVIVGVGINVAGQPFTTPDGRAATTLNALGITPNRDQLRRAVVEVLSEPR